MKYNSIKNIQQTLKNEGIYLPSVDGICGPKTVESILKGLNGGQFKLEFDFITFRKLFNIKTLKQSTVDNINHLLTEVNLYATSNDKVLRQAANPLVVAYLLATTWHETNFTFKPIKETGGNKYLSKYDTGKLAKILGNTLIADGDGILYAGRGYSMITGRRNYQIFSGLLSIDLLGNPDLALNPKVASDILILGSLKGLFTGKNLLDFIKYGTSEEFKEARRVINGTDKNITIALYATKFVECIKIIKIK